MGETVALRYNEILVESVALTEKTVYARTFFERYDLALFHAKKLAQALIIRTGGKPPVLSFKTTFSLHRPP